MNAGDGSGAFGARRLSGFTLFELIVVVCIIAVLGIAALDKLFYYQELAEKRAMEYTVAIVKTGLQLRMAELVSGNRESEIRQLATENPMRWLAEKPANYVGEFREPQSAGSWYFDPGTHHLNYMVRKDSYFESEQSGPKRIEYQVKVQYEPVEMFGARTNVLVGVSLIPTTHYKWF